MTELHLRLNAYVLAPTKCIASGMLTQHRNVTLAGAGANEMIGLCQAQWFFGGSDRPSGDSNHLSEKVRCGDAAWGSDRQ